MYGEVGVVGDFVEILVCGYSFLYYVVIFRYYVIYKFSNFYFI